MTNFDFVQKYEIEIFHSIDTLKFEKRSSPVFKSEFLKVKNQWLLENSGTFLACDFMGAAILDLLKSKIDSAWCKA